MLRVLLVDDEPFILQGLQVLIDWQEQGFEVIGTASNGEEAVEFLKEQKVDLIVADIKMPIMTGLELLARIRQENISDAYFVILSGYADFSYAQEAIRHKCTDYILKPVGKTELLSILSKVKKMHQSMEDKRQDDKRMEQAYLARNIIAIIRGKYDQLNLRYVEEHMKLSEGVRYIGIQLEGLELSEDLTDEDKRTCQRKLYEYCLDYLGEDRNHCIFDVSGSDKIYDIGFIYCDYMAASKGISESKFLEDFLVYLNERLQMPVGMFVGKKVSDFSKIAKSHSTSCVLRTFKGFSQKKNCYFYENEIQVKSDGLILCKNSLDCLLTAIEQNRREDIIKGVDMLYEEMQQTGGSADAMNLNINYMLFQLIHLATTQDSEVNQGEILTFISERSFEEGVMRRSRAHLMRFSCDFAEYLAQLRKNVSRGVLADVEREVRERYAENITLKELSEKYFVNTAYLGQLFRKKYAQSFKDYLNAYRMEQAACLLARTDKKIYEIAEDVGYKDMDYFVNRFILIKGCTPAKYRKQVRMVE